MNTKHTNTHQQNKTLKNKGAREYLKNSEYERPVYCKDELGNYTVERFLSSDHARDEARTATSRIIKHTRRNNCGIAGYIKEVLQLISKGHKGRARTIFEKTPRETLKVVLKSLCDYEKKSGGPIGRVLSIRPDIHKDKDGYFVKRVVLIDNPKKIRRIYKGNDYNDAF